MGAGPRFGLPFRTPNLHNGDPMPPSQRQIMIRRTVAALAAAGVTALLALLLLGGGDSERSAAETPMGVSEKTLEKARELSISDQVDQVMLIGFDGTNAGGKIAEQLAHHEFGGVLIRADNWQGAQDGTKLISALRVEAGSNGRIPPAFATAQEPGDFRELTDLPPEKGELEIGDAGDLGAARDDFEASGKALVKAGILLDLAPIADVATLDSPVGARAFSDDPAVAASMTESALRGCEKAGLACAPGRFPGLGAATQDTDLGPASVSLDAASLEARDLVPFESAIAVEAPAMVISLGLYSAFDAVTPAALAPSIATDLLRDDLGYQGVAITDDLGAGSVKATTTVPQAAVAALTAGSDMIRIDSPKDQTGVREALLAAVDDGTLPKDRLASAAARVLEMKKALGIE